MMNKTFNISYWPESPSCFAWHLQFVLFENRPDIKVTQVSVSAGEELVRTGEVNVSAPVALLVQIDSEIQGYLVKKNALTGNEHELGWK